MKGYKNFWEQKLEAAFENVPVYNSKFKEFFPFKVY